MSAYYNEIVPQVAAEVIGAFMDMHDANATTHTNSPMPGDSGAAAELR